MSKYKLRSLRKAASGFLSDLTTFRVLHIRWIQDGDQWQLVASQKDGKTIVGPPSITVRQSENGRFEYYLNEFGSSLNFSDAQGAKVSAVEFAVAKRRVLYGSYRLKLSA